jgi:hypothetical protein
MEENEDPTLDNDQSATAMISEMAVDIFTS